MGKLKPIHLYLIAVACFLISRIFEHKIQFVYYLLAVIGFAFFFFAIRKYFRK
ncbi:MAG TPA: hypothetical protein VK623_11175 [Flavobacterium sp.]|nr:hypothetical protein [Flavobacterium sp.]